MKHRIDANDPRPIMTADALEAAAPGRLTLFR
jgi:hypothetical protein